MSLAPRLFLDQIDEDLVDLELQFLQAGDVLRLFGLEGIKQRLVLARGVDAALDADLVDQAGEAETGGNHADGAHHRGWIGEDLVTGAGYHVAARGRHILDKDKHLLVLFHGQIADAPVDQPRLNR